MVSFFTITSNTVMNIFDMHSYVREQVFLQGTHQEGNRSCHCFCKAVFFGSLMVRRLPEGWVGLNCIYRQNPSQSLLASNCLPQRKWRSCHFISLLRYVLVGSSLPTSHLKGRILGPYSWLSLVSPESLSLVSSSLPWLHIRIKRGAVKFF